MSLVSEEGVMSRGIVAVGEGRGLEWDLLGVGSFDRRIPYL